MTQTSKEERERYRTWKAKEPRVTPFGKATFATGTKLEFVDRLLADADRCEVLEREVELAELAGDGTDKLCQALYGRPPQAQDYLGGSGARMLHDAAARIVELERQTGLEGNAYERELRLLRERCAELEAEVRRLTELWMDAVCQGSRQKKVGDEYRHFDGAISTWEEAFYELEKRGLAEGNERDGWVLKWLGVSKP